MRSGWLSGDRNAGTCDAVKNELSVGNGYLKLMKFKLQKSFKVGVSMAVHGPEKIVSAIGSIILSTIEGELPSHSSKAFMDFSYNFHRNDQ